MDHPPSLDLIGQPFQFIGELETTLEIPLPFYRSYREPTNHVFSLF